MPCASSASGAGCAKPDSVSANSSPDRTQPGKSPAQARAAVSSSTGTISFAPCASAVTMVVVAKMMSSTTTTLPCTRTLSSSSLRVRTCTLCLSSMLAAKHPPAFHGEHQLAALVDRFPAVLDQPHALARRRRARLEQDADVNQRVAGPHRLEPADVVDARRAQAHRLVDVALDHQPHADRAGLPATRDQPAERALLGLFRVGMKRLRVVLLAEAHDLGLGKGMAPELGALAELEVFPVLHA